MESTEFEQCGVHPQETVIRDHSKATAPGGHWQSCSFGGFNGSSGRQVSEMRLKAFRFS